MKKIIKLFVMLHCNGGVLFLSLLLVGAGTLTATTILPTDMPKFIDKTLIIFGSACLIYAFSIFWVLAIIASLIKAREDKKQIFNQEHIDKNEYFKVAKSAIAHKKLVTTIISIIGQLIILALVLSRVPESYRKYIMTPVTAFIIFSSIIISAIPKDLLNSWEKLIDETYKILARPFGGTSKASKEEIGVLLVIGGIVIISLLCRVQQSCGKLTDESSVWARAKTPIS